MIDYQVSQQTSPAADLHYMIFNCTNHATRKKHYYDWLDYYHLQLDRRLAYFGLKTNFVYPRDQLDADMRRFGKISLGQAVIEASVLARETADAAKFRDTWNSADTNTLEELSEQSRLSATEPETKKKFVEKIEGVVDSFIEFGFL